MRSAPGRAISSWAAPGHARSDAAVLARAADVRLVRVISIHLDGGGTPPPGPRMLRAESMVAASLVSAPPIQPGDVPVQASVTIVYEIAPGQ